MSMARKLGSILLCIIAALPLFTSSAFLLGRIVIRKSMLSNLESSNVLAFQIPKNDLNWYTEGHELLIEGRMFDVKTITDAGEHVVVTGLFDDDETELNQVIAATQGNPGKESSLILFKPCLGLLAIMPTTLSVLEMLFSDPRQNNLSLYNHLLSDGFLRKLIHPPSCSVTI